jgi:hypothetical protein
VLQDDDLDSLQELRSGEELDWNSPVKVNQFYIFDFTDRFLSAFEYSCLFGAVKCFKYILLSNEASVKEEQLKHRFSVNCVHCAVIGGNTEILRMLEMSGFFFDGTIHYSARWHRRNIFQWLFENDHKLNIGFDNGDVIFHSAMALNYYTASVCLKSNTPFDLEQSLVTAVLKSGPVVVRFLFEACHVKVVRNRDLLFQAILRRDLGIVKVVCSNCPELLNECSTVDGVSPIWRAAGGGQIEITRFLSKVPGVNLEPCGDIPSLHGLTTDPLEWACYQLEREVEPLPSIWADSQKKE